CTLVLHLFKFLASCKDFLGLRLIALWGGKFFPPPAFSRRDPLKSGSAATIGRPTGAINRKTGESLQEARFLKRCSTGKTRESLQAGKKLKRSNTGTSIANQENLQGAKILKRGNANRFKRGDPRQSYH